MASNTTQDVVVRLKKIEGQIRGLQRMIDEQKDCSDVVHQLCAARKALDKVGFIILTHRMRECVEEQGRDTEKSMDEAMELFLTMA